MTGVEGSTGDGVGSPVLVAVVRTEFAGGVGVCVDELARVGEGVCVGALVGDGVGLSVPVGEAVRVAVCDGVAVAM